LAPIRLGAPPSTFLRLPFF